MRTVKHYYKIGRRSLFFLSNPGTFSFTFQDDRNSIWCDRKFSSFVAPCLSDAPANGSISGFPLGRVTKVRCGLNGVLGPTSTLKRCRQRGAVERHGSSMSVFMMRVHGANDDTSLGFVDIIYLLYTYTRTPKDDKPTTQPYILVHPNATCSTESTERTRTKERKRFLTCSFYSPLRPTNNYRNYYYIWT